jgi:hypothetical protein
MAFNPFHRFRKYQKPIFAVLVLVCMFVFILQFGTGDIFSRGRGGSGQRGEVVATLYGRAIHYRDLTDLLFQRKMVNDFLLQSAFMADQQSAQEISKTIDQLPGNIEGFVRERRNQQLERKQFARFLPPEQTYEAIRREIQILADFRLKHSDEKPEVRKVLNNLLWELHFEAYITDPAQRVRTEFWLGGGRTTEELLDFLIWRQQADRLGMNLAEGDALTALSAELGGQQNFTKSFAKSTAVQSFLMFGKYKGVQPPELLKAITDELRVVMAKEALLGLAPGFRSYRRSLGSIVSPAAVTPDQFYDFYRKEKTTVNLTVLEIPVANFLNKVEGKPNEKELLDLFEKYKDQVPQPDRKTPGFKEPRKLLVEYINPKADLPAFKAQGRVMAVHAIVAQATLPAGRMGLPLPAALADSLAKEYSSYEEAQKNAWFDFFPKTPQDFFFNRKETFTAAVGQLVGGFAAGTPAGASALPAVTSAVVLPGMAEQERERKRAIVLGLSAIAVAPTIGNPIVLPNTVALMPITPPVLKQSEMAAAFFDKVVEEKSKSQMIKSLTDFATELAKQKNDPDKAAAFVKENLAKLGLQDRYYKMTRPVDRYELEADPDLKKLKEAYTAWVTTRKPEFADLLMASNGIYEPRPFDESWTSSAEPYIFWSAKDVKEVEPKDLAGAEEKVRQAWRLIAAREKARAEARDVITALKKKIEPFDGKVKAAEAVGHLIDEKAKRPELGRLLEMPAVSRLVEPREVVASRNRAYVPFPISKADIAYPAPDFLETVTSMEKPGDSLVLLDNPEKNFYIVVLRDRVEPSMSKFLEVYEMGPADPLWSQNALTTIRREYYQATMRDLRITAAGADKVKDGHLILPPEVSKSLDSAADNRDD